MGSKVLSSYSVRGDIFDRIISDYEDYIEEYDNIEPYFKGYMNKQKIYYNGLDTLIIQAYRIKYMLKDDYDIDLDKDGYIQVVIRKSKDIGAQLVEKDTDGATAWRVVTEWLHMFYTDEDIERCLNAHTSLFSDRLKQMHINYKNTPNKVTRHTDCYYYDINGAHCDALCEIFPRARDFFITKYLQRKECPVIKKYFNYYVGMLCRRGHRLTYNWIVQRTTRKLEKLIDYIWDTDYPIIYANTDGVILTHPVFVFDSHKELGRFKLEYSGDVYTYTGENYMIVQYGDEIKGNVLLSVRDDIDLRQGKVVSYDRIKDDKYEIYYAKNKNVKYVEVIDYGKDSK